MREFFLNVDNSKKNKLFSILTTVLLLLFVVQTLGCVIVQIIFKTDNLLTSKTSIPCLGMEFTLSIFSSLLSSFSNDPKLISTVNSIVTMIFALVFVFMAMSIAKKRKWAFYVDASLYVLDTILIIPTFIINFNKSIYLSLSIVDFILIILFHIIGVSLLTFIFLLWPKKEENLDGVIHVGGKNI